MSFLCEIINVCQRRQKAQQMVPVEMPFGARQYSAVWEQNKTLASIKLQVIQVKVTQPCLTLCDPMDCIVRGILQARILEWVAFPFSRGSSKPRDRDRTGSPTLQVDCLQAEPPEKSKNTGVGSLPLLQWIFLTQESNQGLLHCRWILYWLSNQGSFLVKGRGGRD